MTLLRTFEKEGTWLFRWRSYIPLLLLIPTFAAMWNYHWPNGSEAIQDGWEIVCLFVSFLGLFIRALTVGYVPGGTSGRNTRYQLAAELNTTGMYSIVRNPLYLGNYLMYLGVALFPLVWWLPVLTTLIFWLYYERIVFAEEAFLRLKFGRQFEEWSRQTPAFIPRIALWRRPARSFSIRTILRREYSGLMGLAAVFFGLELLEHYEVEGRIHLETAWVLFLSVSTVLYVFLRWAKRRSTLLRVDHR